MLLQIVFFVYSNNKQNTIKCCMWWQRLLAGGTETSERVSFNFRARIKDHARVRPPKTTRDNVFLNSFFFALKLVSKNTDKVTTNEIARRWCTHESLCVAMCWRFLPRNYLFIELRFGFFSSFSSTEIISISMITKQHLLILVWRWSECVHNSGEEPQLVVKLQQKHGILLTGEKLLHRTLSSSAFVWRHKARSSSPFNPCVAVFMTNLFV